MMKLDLDGNLLKRTAALESGKVNLDAGNLNATGKDTICGYVTPKYDAGSNVTSTVFASSGTGYKPTKKGMLMIKGNIVSNSLAVNIYKASGTLLFQRYISQAPLNHTEADTTTLLIDPNYSVRVDGTNSGTSGIDYYALFFPMRGN